MVMDKRARECEGVWTNTTGDDNGNKAASVFDGETRAAAQDCVRFALCYTSLASEEKVETLSIWFMAGEMRSFWAAVDVAQTGKNSFILSELWWRLCVPTRVGLSDHKPNLAACIVHAFIRAAEFGRSSRPHPSGAASPRFDGFEGIPRRVPDESLLHMAVHMNPTLAHALLDLPSEYGVDVNATEQAYGVDIPAAIGHTNLSSTISLRLFARLLHRTNPSVLNRGFVYVDSGCEQWRNPNTHVLIANIFRMHDLHEYAYDVVRLLVASAQPDGDGVDLTAGVQVRGHYVKSVPDPKELWPEFKFRGALSLVERLYHWWSISQRSISTTAEFKQIRDDIVFALTRVRNYRQTVGPTVADQLHAAGIHSKELRALVVLFILIPLHDESQLDHYLLDLNHNEKKET